MTRNYVQRKLGTGLIIFVNPRSISYDVGTRFPCTHELQKFIWHSVNAKCIAGILQGLCRRIEPFVVPRNCYRDPRPLESFEKYQKLQNFIENRNSIEVSKWYREKVNELETLKVAKHKQFIMRSRSEIDSFFRSYILDLVDSMDRCGYIEGKSDDIGTAFIGNNGLLHKSANGTHRFYIARILGIKLIPLKIMGVHQDWFRSRNLTNKRACLTNILDAIKEVERNHRTECHETSLDRVQA